MRQQYGSRAYMVRVYPFETQAHKKQQHTYYTTGDNTANCPRDNIPQHEEQQNNKKPNTIFVLF